MLPQNPIYTPFNAPIMQTFQSPSEDLFDPRDRDLRPAFNRHAEADNTGGDSPSDGLQIDENA
jgi:hypothetical protein